MWKFGSCGGGWRKRRDCKGFCCPAHELSLLRLDRQSYRSTAGYRRMARTVFKAALSTTPMQAYRQDGGLGRFPECFGDASRGVPLDIIGS